MQNTRFIFIVLFVLGTATGCSKNSPPLKQMHGKVTCDGEIVPLGAVTFVPIDNASSTPAQAMIVDGQYRFQEPAGVPLGKHRVVVVARKKTGRQVEGFNGIEMATIDEEVPMGPEIYAGPKSPLTVEVTHDSDDRFDINIPPT